MTELGGAVRQTHLRLARGLPTLYVMRLGKVLTVTKLARSGSEATRLIRQGAVSVGGCKPDCQFPDIGKCTCNGWTKITDPIAEIEVGLAVKIGDGHWRVMNRIDGAGWDQVKGIGRVPDDQSPSLTE